MKDDIAPRPLPDMPTTHPPCTAEKEAVMRERLRMQRQLHHPADARYPGDPTPLLWVHWREKQRKERLAAATARIFDKIKAKKK